MQCGVKFKLGLVWWYGASPSTLMMMIMTGDDDDLEDLRAFDDPPPRWKMWGRLLQLWGRLLRSRVLPKLAAHLFCFEHTAQISHLLPLFGFSFFSSSFSSIYCGFSASSPLSSLNRLLNICSIGCLLILWVKAQSALPSFAIFNPVRETIFVLGNYLSTTLPIFFQFLFDSFYFSF